MLSERKLSCKQLVEADRVLRGKIDIRLADDAGRLLRADRDGADLETMGLALGLQLYGEAVFAAGAIAGMVMALMT